MSCPKCSSDQIDHEGKGNLYSRGVEFEFFVCRDCGTQFVQNPEVEGPKEDRSIPTRDELLKKIRWQNEIEYARQDRIEEILSTAPLPFPPRYKQLLQALQDPQSGPDEYETILLESPAVSDRLHALVCGPLFDLQPRPHNLAEVFTREDPAHLAEMVLAVEVMATRTNPKSQELDWNQFWRHGIATGLAAWSLARILDEEQPYRLFVAGLLHDFGRYLLFIQSASTAKEIVNESRKTGRNLTDLEMELLDFDHTQIGAAQLKRWKLADPLLQAIQFHHKPLECKKQMRLACILHISDILTYNLKLGTSGETPLPYFESEAVKKLGLTRSQVSSVKGQVSGLMIEIEDALLKGKSPYITHPG